MWEWEKNQISCRNPLVVVALQVDELSANKTDSERMTTACTYAPATRHRKTVMSLLKHRLKPDGCAQPDGSEQYYCTDKGGTMIKTPVSCVEFHRLHCTIPYPSGLFEYFAQFWLQNQSTRICPLTHAINHQHLQITQRVARSAADAYSVAATPQPSGQTSTEAVQMMWCLGGAQGSSRINPCVISPSKVRP